MGIDEKELAPVIGSPAGQVTPDFTVHDLFSEDPILSRAAEWANEIGDLEHRQALRRIASTPGLLTSAEEVDEVMENMRGVLEIEWTDIEGILERNYSPSEGTAIYLGYLGIKYGLDLNGEFPLSSALDMVDETANQIAAPGTPLEDSRELAAGIVFEVMKKTGQIRLRK